MSDEEPVQATKRSRILLESDSSDGDDDDEAKNLTMVEDTAGDAEENNGEDKHSQPADADKEEQLAKIFDESSSDDEDGNEWTGFGEDDYVEPAPPSPEATPKKKKKTKGEGKKRRRATPEPADTGPKTDFEEAMERRKIAMAKKRKKQDSEDLSSASATHDAVKALKQLMRTAWEEDERHLKEQKTLPKHLKKPAFQKLSRLDFVCNELRKESLQEDFIEMNIFEELKNWLMLGERGALPSILIRNKLIPILSQQFVNVEIEYIKASKIGQVLNMLKQHPLETPENKKKLSQVLNTWARIVFNSHTDPSTVSVDERMAHLASVTNDSMRNRRASAEEEPAVKLRPGDAGFVMRARVPIAVGRDYTRRPQPKQSLLNKLGEGELEKLKASKKTFIKQSAGKFDVMSRKLKTKAMSEQKHKLHARSVNLSGNLTGNAK